MATEKTMWIGIGQAATLLGVPAWWLREHQDELGLTPVRPTVYGVPQRNWKYNYLAVQKVAERINLDDKVGQVCG